jgi:hypothetical protein
MQSRSSTSLSFPLLLAASGLVACGGSSNTTAADFTGTVTVTSALTGPAGGAAAVAACEQVSITANGVDRHAVSVPGLAGGGCVTFTNNDTVDHQIDSGVHPTHTTCPELNSDQHGFPGHMHPGDAFTATMGAGPKNCTWHDHLNPPASGGGGMY